MTFTKAVSKDGILQDAVDGIGKASFVSAGKQAELLSSAARCFRATSGINSYSHSITATYENTNSSFSLHIPPGRGKNNIYICKGRTL